MIRNMELIRAMVLAIRQHEGRPSASEVQALISDEDNGVYSYHVELLIQGDLITAVDTSPRKDRYGKANLALTWAGQDFADNLVSDEIWASAKQTLAEANLDAASFQIWTQLAIKKITQRCG
ncbi:DUF2513 domain-containing protein [Planctomycetes bacterium K23_9]|uniref:DUF2513 domain-containing protein n=1 Tax=Stieleria marina TaxID=1930275 RepID=A0A517NW14_9BACT|nr:hypothetical protein K239x_33180 [Planctomycetes bacterium K23_9]